MIQTIATAGEYLETLNDSRSPSIENIEAPIEVWKEIIEEFPSKRGAVARNKTLPEEIIHSLANDPDPKIRLFIATRRELPLSVLEKLSRDVEWSIRKVIAGNSSAPTSLLQELSADLDPKVGAMAKGNILRRTKREKPPNPYDPKALSPLKSVEEYLSLIEEYDPWNQFRSRWSSAPVDVWLDLIERYPTVRQAVANNSTLPYEVVKRLARDKDWRVQLTVLSKASRFPDLLESMSKDRKAMTRDSIARNPNTPIEILERLSKDRISSVAESAKANLDGRQN